MKITCQAAALILTVGQYVACEICELCGTQHHLSLQARARGLLNLPQLTLVPEHRPGLAQVQQQQPQAQSNHDRHANSRHQQGVVNRIAPLCTAFVLKHQHLIVERLDQLHGAVVFNHQPISLIEPTFAPQGHPLAQ